MADLFFSKDTNEPAEPLNGATDGFLIEQPASGGVRRQKWLFLDGLRDWIQTKFTNLIVAGSITQTSGTTTLLQTTMSANNNRIGFSSTVHAVLFGSEAFTGFDRYRISYNDLTTNTTRFDTISTEVSHAWGSANSGGALLTHMTLNGAGRLILDGVDNTVDLMQVGVGQNESVGFGRTSVFADSVTGFLSYYSNNNTTDYALAYSLAGAVGLNAKVGQSVFIQNGAANTLAEFAALVTNLLKPVTINGAVIGTHQLAVNGTAANNTGVWAVLSDIIMKMNIDPITNPIDKLKFLAPKFQHFNYKPGINEGLGRRTGIIIDDELEAEYPGHISYCDPQNEAEGIELGWTYKDENYNEEVPVMETIKVPKIQDGKIVYTDQEIQKTEITMVGEIRKKTVKVTEKVTGNKMFDSGKRDNSGGILYIQREVTIDVVRDVDTDELIIMDIPQKTPVTKTVKKTRRVVVTEGRQKRIVENSFDDYLFPALLEVVKRLEKLEGLKS